MSEKLVIACPECQTRFVAPLEKFLPEGRKVRCAKCGHSWFHQLENHLRGGSAATTDGIEASESAVASDDQAAQAATEVPAAPTQRTPQTKNVGILDRAIEATQNDKAHATSSESQTGTLAAAAGIGAGVGAVAATTASSAPVSDDASDDRLLSASSDPDFSEMPDPKPISTGEGAGKRSFWPRAILYSLAAAIIAGCLGYFFKDPIASSVPALDPPLTSWKSTVDGVVSSVIPENQSLKIENVEYSLEQETDEKAMLLTAEVINEGDEVAAAPELTATIYGPDDNVLKTLSVSPKESAASEIDARSTLSYFLRLPFPPETLERVEVDFTK